MQFSVYLYDDQTNPLKVSNVDVELYDSSANTLLDTQISGKIGTANEWGAILHWNPSLTNAVEILFNDPTCTYSGTAIVDINGALSGRIDVVLHGLPPGAGGHGGFWHAANLALDRHQPGLEPIRKNGRAPADFELRHFDSPAEGRSPPDAGDAGGGRKLGDGAEPSGIPA
ncbi:MAG: hypothetical protein H7144_15780 [Burkholderiales bacterium]|nr:hypothetical protein [Phycisphaerae bacterium]